ncbi:prephenate dehydratase [Niallia sp. BSM11]|uniref:prephenate dehydratase n=1 Tax=Niallia sp. BSM11 TaxID=3391576 RepID=UPI003984C8DB
MKVGYLGPKATFTNIAVNKMFPNAEKLPYMTIPNCMDAVMKGEVEAALVPVENTLEGSVNITLDYLIHEVDIPIKGEITVPIKQHLMVHPNFKDRWKDAEVVFSHSHAIAQCHRFLHAKWNGIRCENTTSTAAAAQYIKENPNLAAASIGNELTAAEYGLEIVKRNIHDFDNNHTRFIIISKKDTAFQPVDCIHLGYKTSLMVSLPADESGALHQVLSAFAWRKLNLVKIESRPTKTGLGNYFFIIDIDRELDDVLIPGAMSELEAIGCDVKLLGSYPFYAGAKS